MNSFIKQGDCIKLMKQLVDTRHDPIQCCVTDIPYGEVNRSSNGLRSLNKGKADIETFDIDEFLSLLLKLVSGSFYIFCSTEQVSSIRRFFIGNGLSTRLIICEKTNPSPMNGQHIWLSGVECCVYAKKKGAVFNGHCENTVLRFPCGRNKLHPTQKPEKLIEKLIEISSNQGDIIFDPCMGSGTTCVCATKLNRKYIGFELDENYFNIAKERIENTVSIMNGESA